MGTPTTATTFGRFALASALITGCGVLPWVSCYAEMNFEKAKEHIQSGNYARAAKALEKVPPNVNGGPNEAVLNNTLGWTYFSAGRTAEAEEKLKAALEGARDVEDQDTARRAANNLGILYFVNNDLEASAHQFSQPENSDSQLALRYLDLIEKKSTAAKVEKFRTEGASLTREKNFDGAIAQYDQALALNKDHAETLAFKGYALFRKGSYKEAVRVLQKARTADPSRDLVELNLAKAYCASNDETRLAGLLQKTAVPLDTFREWWIKDAEFRNSCAESDVITTVAEHGP